MVNPTHAVNVPLIVGKPLIVTVAVVWHPLLFVYVIVEVPADTPVIKGSGAGTDVSIVATTGTNTATWVFSATGAVVFPDGTVQTSAYTGAGGSGPNLQDYNYNIDINGEGLGLTVDAAGLKRFGFMKYSGIEGALVHSAGLAYSVPLRVGRVSADDVTYGDQNSFTTEIFIATNGYVGIGDNNTSPSERLDVDGNVHISGILKLNNDASEPVANGSTDKITLWNSNGNYNHSIGVSVLCDKRELVSDCWAVFIAYHITGVFFINEWIFLYIFLIIQ